MRASFVHLGSVEAVQMPKATSFVSQASYPPQMRKKKKKAKAVFEVTMSSTSTFAPTVTFITNKPRLRSHTKSHGGCSACKARKVKASIYFESGK